MTLSPMHSRCNARQGFSLMELLIVVAIILIIAIVAIPTMSTALMSTRESAAVREIQAIHVAQVSYNSQFGRYAQNLAELGPPANDGASSTAAGLLPGTLASGKHSGHVFVLALTPTGYAINVSPEKYKTDGRKNFYSDETGVIRERWSAEPATALDPPIGTAAK
jgi:type IV pilus assembly protein PilA